MTTVPDSKQDHIQCSISDTDLFTPAFVQSDIETGRREDTYPITKLKDIGLIEFANDNASGPPITRIPFLNLQNYHLPNQ